MGSWNYYVFALGSVHDIAVTNAKPSKTVVGLGSNVSVNVTVTNEGNLTEAFNLTVDVVSVLSGVHTIEGIEQESISGLLTGETRLVLVECNTAAGLTGTIQ